MNLAQLAYFDAACRKGSLTEAARDVFVTQQAVSSGISALERELGVRLLDRTVAGVRPTASGQELLPEVRAVLKAAARLRSKAAALHEDARGSVAFAYATCSIGTSERHPNQADLGTFTHNKPGLTLRLFETASDACLALVSQGTADVALVAGQPDPATFGGVFLQSPELVLCVPADHPFASRDGTLSYSELRGVPQFLPPDLNYSLHATDAACQTWGFAPTYVKASSAAGENQVECVATGQGVAFMPDGHEPALADGRVRLVHMRPEEACHIPLWLAWSLARDTSPAVQAFIEFIRGLFAQ